MGLFGTNWTPLADIVRFTTNTVSAIGGAAGNVVGSVAGAATPLVTSTLNTQGGSAFAGALGSSLLGGGAAPNPFAAAMGAGGARSAPVLKEATFLNKLVNIYKTKDPSTVTANGKEYMNYDYDPATGKQQISWGMVVLKATVVLFLIYAGYKVGKKKRWF